MSDTSTEEELLSQLPTPYRVDSLRFTDPVTGQQATVRPTADFLKAFESVLLSGAQLGDASVLGIEHQVDKLASYFVAGDRNHPEQPQAPEEFLPWLASWLAFSMRADLPETVHRDFIHNLTTLYHWRGTQENLKRVLEYFTGLKSTASTVTVNSTDPHCFEVKVDLSALIASQALSDVPRLVEIAHALIRREKPAHTRYVLAPMFPSFRLGEADPDGNIKTDFFTQVHGYVENPSDPNKTVEVGNTLLGIHMWKK